MKFFRFLTETIGWLQIVAGPFLLGALIGFLVYHKNQNSTGLITGMLIAAAGLVLGIIAGIFIRKKTGTVNFLSRVNASPELDKKDEK